MLVAGIDIGTTTVCGVLADAGSGQVIESLTEKNDSFIRSENDFERIQDSGRIAEKTQAIAERLTDGREKEIAAIGFSGQMHGIIYLDASGNALSPLYTWQDARGDRPFGGSTFARELSALTGHRCAAGFGLTTHYYNKVCGLAPEKAAAVCTAADFAAMRLCGKSAPVMHSSSAASLGVFDLASGGFDERALSRAEIGTELLPRVTGDAEVIGRYKGIPVAVALGDNQASFIGSTRNEGCLLVNIGTGSQISAQTRVTQPTENCEIRPLYGDRAIAVGSALCGGRAYALLAEFFRECAREFGGTEPSLEQIYARMGALASAAKEPLPKVEPLFCGTRSRPELRASVTGLDTENLAPGPLAAGMLEGMADELRREFDEMRGGLLSEELTLVGSGNAVRLNPLLRQALERRFGMRLLVPRHREEAAFGAAVFASAAAGLHADVQKAQRAMVTYEE